LVEVWHAAYFHRFAIHGLMKLTAKSTKKTKKLLMLRFFILFVLFAFFAVKPSFYARKKQALSPYFIGSFALKFFMA
jgi:hypothetical protein